MSENIRSISDVLTELKSTLPAEKVSLSYLLEAFHERGFGFFLLIFALPMALPLPVPPGINVLLATPLILLTAQQALGRHTIWMPEKMKKKAISSEKAGGLIGGTIPWMKRLEMLSKPRLSFMTQGLFSNIIGLLGLIMALTVCIPLPLTNTVPSFGIAVMALGVINRDGLAVLGGAIIGGLWVTMLTTAFVIFGTEGIDLLKETIKSFL